METKPCKIDGCKRKIFAKKLCGMHYSRIRNGIKDMRPDPIRLKWSDDDPRLKKNKNLKCGVTNCKEKYFAKGYCRKHYLLNKRNGSPVRIRELPKPICKIPSCNEISTSIKSGLCSFHLRRKRKNVHLCRPKGNKGELNHRWNGGISEYPNHYDLKKNRLIVLEESNYICHYCGGKADRVHHKDKPKDNHSIKNLAPSCASCNSKRQDNSNRRYYIRDFGISSTQIMNRLDLTRQEVKMMYDNGYLKNVLKLHRLLK